MSSEHLNYPTLIVITGRPGAGKSTLTHALARTIRCPIISRDEIKEGLINTIKHGGESPDSDLNKHVYDTFFETIEFLLQKQITFIAEAAFQHKLWAPKLDNLSKLAHIKIIICSISPSLAQARYIQRGIHDPERANFHDDWTIQEAEQERLTRPYDPPKLDVPTLTVDTSEDYQPTFSDIVTFINT
jgi:predicted kinase